MFLELLVIAFILFFLTEAWLFTKGYDTNFWVHKTEAEKQIQQNKIEKMKV